MLVVTSIKNGEAYAPPFYRNKNCGINHNLNNFNKAKPLASSRCDKFKQNISTMKTLSKARYIRISSATQSTARQLAKQHPDEQLFIDVCSGAIPFNQREQGKALLDAIEAGTINYITTSSVDRLGRNSFNIQEVLNQLTDKGVNVRVENLGNLESLLPNGKPNSIFKMITDVLANVATMERDAILERQSEGLKIYKAKNEANRKLGIVQTRNKPSASDDEVLTKYKDVAKELKIGKNSLRKVAVLGGVSLATVQKVKAILDKQKGVTE